MWNVDEIGVSSFDSLATRKSRRCFHVHFYDQNMTYGNKVVGSMIAGYEGLSDQTSHKILALKAYLWHLLFPKSNLLFCFHCSLNWWWSQMSKPTVDVFDIFRVLRISKVGRQTVETSRRYKKIIMKEQYPDLSLRSHVFHKT